MLLLLPLLRIYTCKGNRIRYVLFYGYEFEKDLRDFGYIEGFGADWSVIRRKI
jgi:hypothetical protein